MMRRNWVFILSCLTLLTYACRKEDTIDKNPDVQLQFSTDSILFDTVFTNSGSTDRILKVFNNNNKSVLLSDIHLAGGDSSFFKININGTSSSSLNNLKIKGKDSIYVFIKAFINPNNDNSPFLIEDELQFNLNGNMKKIPLLAYGQNAIYLNKMVINSNTTFTKNKPYIVHDYAVIAENTILNIPAGTKIYFHKNAQLYVSGSLKANGTRSENITFCSDRLEKIYNDEPGQWEGIHFLKSSKDNQLNYAMVKNALIGIRVDSLSNNDNPKLLLTNSIVKNHEVAGILGYTASITGLNNLIYNCGQYLMLGLYGGDYNFYQNTLADYNYNFSRVTPAVFFSDNLNDGSPNLTKSLNCVFVNNIIHGGLTKEFDVKKTGNGVFLVNLQNNLIKTDVKTWGDTNIYDQDPLFINSRKENYHLSADSPARGIGKDLSGNSYFSNYLNRDLNQNSRGFPSALGCFER